jgi:hypothetical protein
VGIFADPKAAKVENNMAALIMALYNPSCSSVNAYGNNHSVFITPMPIPIYVKKTDFVL